MNNNDYDTEEFESHQVYGNSAPITAFMNDEIIAVEPTASLREAAIALEQGGIGCIVVGDPENVEGVVSERDILRAVAEGLDLDETPVTAVESTSLKWATPDSLVGEVVGEMMNNYVRHVLVGEDSRLIGMVHMRDMLAAYLA
jgi:CBS domain-containing protein